MLYCVKNVIFIFKWAYGIIFVNFFGNMAKNYNFCYIFTFYYSLDYISYIFVCIFQGFRWRSFCLALSCMSTGILADRCALFGNKCLFL